MVSKIRCYRVTRKSQESKIRQSIVTSVVTAQKKNPVEKNEPGVILNEEKYLDQLKQSCRDFKEVKVWSIEGKLLDKFNVLGFDLHPEENSGYDLVWEPKADSLRISYWHRY